MRKEEINYLRDRIDGICTDALREIMNARKDPTFKEYLESKYKKSNKKVVIKYKDLHNYAYHGGFCTVERLLGEDIREEWDEMMEKREAVLRELREELEKIEQNFMDRIIFNKNLDAINILKDLKQELSYFIIDNS